MVSREVSFYSWKRQLYKMAGKYTFRLPNTNELFLLYEKGKIVQEVARLCGVDRYYPATYKYWEK